MDRDEAKARGQVLRTFLRSQLPGPEARSITALARKAGLRPNTLTSWWSKGYVPDNNSLRLLADALGVELSDLVATYEGSSGRTWVLTDHELEALIERTVEMTVRRVMAERESAVGGDTGERTDEPGAAPRGTTNG
jgi:transcriptional regulator with XRE-family HTH domain